MFEFSIQMSKNLKLLPKTFVRKSFKKTNKTNVLCCGYYGIKSCQSSKLTLKNVNFLKKFLEKQFSFVLQKKKIKIWNKIVTSLTTTKISSESRMGKGKGSVVGEFSFIRPGQIIFEVEKIPLSLMKKVFIKICKQLSFKVKLIVNA